MLDQRSLGVLRVVSVCAMTVVTLLAAVPAIAAPGQVEASPITMVEQRHAWMRIPRGTCPGGELHRRTLDEVVNTRCPGPPGLTFHHIELRPTQPQWGDLYCTDSVGTIVFADSLTDACGTEGEQCEVRYPNFGGKGGLLAAYCEKVTTRCPIGYSLSAGKCVAATAALDKHGCNPPCGSSGADPIDLYFGNNYQIETDYTGAGPFPLRFQRTYGSNQFSWVRSLHWDVQFGSLGLSHWIHSYSARIVYSTGGGLESAYVWRADGKVLIYTLINGVWTPDTDISHRLERLTDAGGAPIGWRLTTDEDLTETYDVNGRLISVANRAGLAHTLSYNALGQLESVSDSMGRALTFTYNADAFISVITDPEGGQYQYSYYTNYRLQSVTYPGGATRTYHYENPTFPQALTGISDENNSRFVTWSYTNEGLADSSELAGGVSRYVITRNSTIPRSQATVTDPLGSARTSSASNVVGAMRTTTITGPACPSCGPAARTYDANGNLASRTDWNGNVTGYQYDLTRNLELTRTEASGTPQARTITTAWDATYRLPTQIAEPFRITTMVYGDPSDPSPGNRGSLLSRTIQATTDANGSLGFSAPPVGAPRTWTYTYNDNGQVLTMDGPRTDVSDVTAYAYYSNNATCTGASPIGCRGQIQTITNAAGHVTQITDYNAHGQPLSITDPNGLVTTLTYDPRQRLTSRNVGGEITTYTYDNVGQLTRVTLPDTSFLNYTYDAAHRLTDIADNLGNRIAYTLDAMGNRIQEQVFDPVSQLAQTRSRVYSNLNRLAQEIGAAGQTTGFGYDNQGNLTSIDGPLAGTVDVTTNQYDALNRLIQMTDPLTGQVNYGYNGLDQLTSVTDPRTLVTSYSYDGLNNLNQLQSPDTGTTVNTYDTAGNLLTQMDAKGQLTTYAYDALNRVTSIVYQGGVTHSYQYDQGTNGIGRLTQITEPNSTTQYAYDQHGRVVSETRTINAVPYVTAYSYDGTGRMTGVTYPSGRTVTYTLDALGRIQQIDTTKDSTTQTVVSSVTYRPFGPTQGFTFGNGQTYTRGFDQDGRVSSYTQGTQTIAVGYDPASRITSLAEVGNPPNTNTYGYDTLDRLTSVNGPIANQAFTYDGVGNRTSKTVGVIADTYTYDTTSNRLSQITGGSVRTYSYDNNGSTLGDSINQYVYDTRGRLTQAISVVGTTDYQVNSLGQRIRKSNAQRDTVYHYDTQGRLIAETSPGGTVRKEYIYLGDIPVAVIQ